MKTIYEILANAPKKELVTLVFKYDGEERAVAITEEQVRWLQCEIAAGEYCCDDAELVSPDGSVSRFAKDGRLTSPLSGLNTMTLNDELAMNLLFYKCKHV